MEEGMEKRILWGVMFGILVYVIIMLVMDAGKLGEQALLFPWWIFAAALGLTVINYGVRFLKWQYYLKTLGFRVGWGVSLNVFLAGMVMSVTPGKIGEVLKSVLLREACGIPAAQTAPIIVAERLTDLLGLFLIASLGVALFDYGRWAFFISLALVGGGVLLLGQPRVVGWGIVQWARLPGVGKLHVKLGEAYASMRQLLGPKVLGVTTVMSALSWSMEGVAFYWFMLGLNAPGASLFKAMFIFSMTTILGAVSFLPGGLGVTEGGMIAGLKLLGVFEDTASAALATYLIRFATLWFGVLLGFVALLLFKRRVGQGAPKKGEEGGERGEIPEL